MFLATGSTSPAANLSSVDSPCRWLCTSVSLLGHSCCSSRLITASCWSIIIQMRTERWAVGSGDIIRCGFCLCHSFGGLTNSCCYGCVRRNVLWKRLFHVALASLPQHRMTGAAGQNSCIDRCDPDLDWCSHLSDSVCMYPGTSRSTRIWTYFSSWNLVQWDDAARFTRIQLDSAANCVEPKRYLIPYKRS